MSETWLDEAVNLTTVQIEGFTPFRQDRGSVVGTKKRGGGLLTLVRNKYASDCELMPELSAVSRDVEALWMTIHREHCKDVIICNTYRPPSGKLDRFVTYNNECIKSLDLSKVELFILGDMNVNYKNKTSADFKKLSFFTKSNGLTQLITNTTRNTDKTISLLDLILTNSKYISLSGTLDHFISDHQPVFTVKKKGRDNRPNTEFKGRSYRNFDKDIFKEKLLSQNWEEFYKLADPGQAWDVILDSLMPILNDMCPIRTFKIRNYRPDWITPELVEQIKDRDYFYKKAKREGDADSWNIAKHLRNVTNANIRQAKREYILNEMDNCKGDSRKFWHLIRTVIPSNKGSSRKDILLKDENGNKLNKKKVAEYINDYFINFGNVGPTVHSCSNQSQAPGINENTDDSWSPGEFMVREVLDVIKTIKFLEVLWNTEP